MLTLKQLIRTFSYCSVQRKQQKNISIIFIAHMGLFRFFFVKLISRSFAQRKKNSLK